MVEKEMVGTKEDRTVCVLPKDICSTINCQTHWSCPSPPPPTNTAVGCTQMPRLWFTASESLTLNLFLESTTVLIQAMTQGNHITVMKVAGLGGTTWPLWTGTDSKQVALCGPGMCLWNMIQIDEAGREGSWVEEMKSRRSDPGHSRLVLLIL